MNKLTGASDHGFTTVPWLGETKSFGDFTLILIKVCSPGPITDVELIISLYGLYWMFIVCARWASPEAEVDLKDQAMVCKSSLEVVLSTLNFWLPTTVDTILAMNLAVSETSPTRHATLVDTMLTCSRLLLRRCIVSSKARSMHAGLSPTTRSCSPKQLACTRPSQRWAFLLKSSVAGSVCFGQYIASKKAQRSDSLVRRQ